MTIRQIPFTPPNFSVPSSSELAAMAMCEKQFIHQKRRGQVEAPRARLARVQGVHVHRQAQVAMESFHNQQLHQADTPAPSASCPQQLAEPATAHSRVTSKRRRFVEHIVRSLRLAD